MAAIDSVYNYYLTTYGKSARSSRYESHKRSELRDTYNRIVKANRDTPLYRIDMNADVEKFAIDLKEQARKAKNIVSSLSVNGGGIEGIYNRKIADSSNEEAVDVEYIGDGTDSSAAGFDLGVERLATPQITTGNYLRSDGHDFERGNFSFDLDTPNNSYEFQFDIEGTETNGEVQQKIARLVNRSDLGLSARVTENGSGESALELISKQTGLKDDEPYLFRIQSGSSWNEVRRLGIDRITEPAGNAQFTLNGTEHTALSNNFTINNAFEVTLKDTTDTPAHIGFKTNTEAVGDSVRLLLDAYNSLVRVGENYSRNHGNGRLANEVTAVGRSMQEELNDAGITADNSGILSVDQDRLTEALSGDRQAKTFHTLNIFKNAVARQADKASINPMNYVNKVIVEYRNPGHTFTAPYATSLYAGMLINRAL